MYVIKEYCEYDMCWKTIESLGAHDDKLSANKTLNKYINNMELQVSAPYRHHLKVEEEA